MLKITLVIIALSFMQVRAAVYAQHASIKAKNISLKEVFSSLRHQTGYHFLYLTEDLSHAKPVSLDFKDAPLEEILEYCFSDQPLSYKIRRNRILVERRTIQKPIQPQPILASGRITDEEGNALQGVTVRAKGTQVVVISDQNGHFNITLSAEKQVLTFSAVGFEMEERTVSKNEVVQLTLRKTNESLNEIVVIGYGTVRKRDLTGAVSQVKTKELNAFPSSNVLQSLSGRAPGVQIRQGSGAPGAGVSVRIRGGNSIQGSNEPLYVIDGFPVSGNPTQLNNSDIESVEILKDASATAIYGSRGANGVVLITTKRGKAGKTVVEFASSYSTQSLIRKLDLMGAQEYALFYNEQAANDNMSPYFSQAEIDGFGKGFDWQDFVFQKAPMSSTSLNIHGGNENTQFSLAGSLFGQNGIVKGSDYNRYSLQTSINHKISDKFRVDFSSTLTRLETERKDSAGGSRGNSMISAAISAPPTLTPYNEDGSYRVLSTAYPFIATDIINPINFINEQSREIRANTILINAALTYEIAPSLLLKISGGIENRDDREDAYTTKKFFNSQGSASVNDGQFMSLLNENTLSYHRTFNEKHTLSTVVGFTYQDFLNTSLGGAGNGFLSDIFETHNLGAAITPSVPSSGYIKSVLLSFLGRVNYNFDDKYLGTLSLRRDGSSRYSEGSKWGYFPSAALAWRISNEDFLKGNEVLSDLKLRASWGLTGSQAIGPYTTLNQLFSGKTVFNDELVNTFAPGTRLPGQLKWETTEQIDIGLDVGLLNNRFVLTADYYIKNTRDLLSVVILPSSLGFTSTIQNVGKIQNTGIEFGLDARLLEGNFLWSIAPNISFNKNKVIKLFDGDDILRDNVAVVAINDVTGILREGQPVGRFWGYLEEGYDETGDIIFKDIDGDGVISPKDKTYIGDANPNFSYGFNSTMRYKNFELNVFIQGLQGNNIFNASAIVNTMDYGFGLNMTKKVYDNHWTPERSNPDFPIISNSTPIRVSDRFMEDGSYLRLKNVMLTYHLPVETLGVKWVKDLQVYASGQNLLTLTNYSWWDPEMNFRLDHNSYPASKAVTFGFRAQF